MESKNKAKELISKFNFDYNSELKEYTINQSVEESKRCSLIAVDEIIEEVREFCDDNFINDRLHYWQRVKNEIEKL